MKKFVLPIAIILMLFSVPLNYANGKTTALHQSVKKKIVIQYGGTYGGHDFVVIANSAHVITDAYEDGEPVTWGATGFVNYVSGTLVFDGYQIGDSYVTGTFYPIN